MCMARKKTVSIQRTFLNRIPSLVFTCIALVLCTHWFRTVHVWFFEWCIFIMRHYISVEMMKSVHAQDGFEIVIRFLALLLSLMAQLVVLTFVVVAEVVCLCVCVGACVWLWNHYSIFGFTAQCYGGVIHPGFVWWWKRWWYVSMCVCVQYILVLCGFTVL